MARPSARQRSIPPGRFATFSNPASRRIFVAWAERPPARKQDPGELFPWGELALAGIGLWPQTRKSRLSISFADGLRAFGYGMRPDMDVPDETVTEAFQRHFRPARIDGVADKECEAILAALLHEIDFKG